MHALLQETEQTSLLLPTCGKYDLTRSQAARLSIGVTPTSVSACARGPFASLNRLLVPWCRRNTGTAPADVTLPHKRQDV